MIIDLSNKTAVVTGSTLGIGFAIAKGLAQSGATVIVNGRTEKAVGEAIGALKREVPKAVIRGVAADLSTAEGCDKLVLAEPDADILINNVGIFNPQDFFAIPDSEWTRFFDVNVMSGVRLSRAYVPGMLTRNWGRVVFISSESGLNPPTEMIHYGFTKTAQLAISRGLAQRLAGTNVTVNAVLARPDLVRRRRGDAGEHAGSERRLDRRGGEEIRDEASAELDHPARRDGRKKLPIWSSMSPRLCPRRRPARR